LLLGVSVCGTEDAGFAAGGVCCAVLGKEKTIANTRAMNGRTTNFIGKHFSPEKNPTAMELTIASF
jgi:hypothetical protein